MPKLTTFGQHNDLPLVQATLESGDSSVSLLSLGAITQGWRVSHDGHNLPTVLGHSDPLAYLTDDVFMGAIAGRVANRTALGKFSLDGQDYQLPINNGPNHLHGGPDGLHRWNFAVETDSAANAVRFTQISPDGHAGYPGNVAFSITVTLDGNRLTYDMEGHPDRPTPINLAQHSYYNLSGEETCLNHKLWLASETYTPIDENSIPTGAIDPVEGTRFDYRTMRSIDEADPNREGLDMNLVLTEGRDTSKPMAKVQAANGLQMQMWSDEKGVQLYNSMHLGRVEGGHDGATYDRFAGIVLEPQQYPNVVNTPAFGNIICTPDAPYRQTLTVEISTY